MREPKIRAVGHTRIARESTEQRSVVLFIHLKYSIGVLD